jgi:preprotein translocase subunit YajC
LYGLLLLILFVPLFWVMIIRPQQVRQRAHRELVGTLAAGDRVETFSGIHGTLVEVADTTVRIEVAPGVVLTMARLAVADRLRDEERAGDPTAEDPVADDDLEDQVTDRSHGSPAESSPTEPSPEEDR